MVFRYLTADQRPDHDTIATFRQQHPDTLAGWLPPALPLCQKAGLVKLGQVAIDGSKIAGNASKHKAMSYGRMNETEKKLQAEVEALLQRAEAVDAAEDEKYGKEQAGELREWLGHESLDVTLAHLKGSDAASEPVQEQVANGALAAYV